MSNLQLRNQGLLFKWLSRFFVEPSALWRKVIQEKYNYPPYITMVGILDVNKGGLWKNICNSLARNTNASYIIRNCIRRQLGNGVGTLFWFDIWASDMALKDNFPRLFSISPSHMATTNQTGSCTDCLWAWNLNWKQGFRPVIWRSGKNSLIFLIRSILTLKMRIS